MIIHKSFSKNDLIDLINLLNLPIRFSHQDNKKSIQDKIVFFIDDAKPFSIMDNYHGISNKQDLGDFLLKQNPKKTLTIKEKNAVMKVAKYIINYCKSNFDIDNHPYYSETQQIEDDLDWIKQYGDIPSVRRCCRLLQNDPKFACRTFVPLMSPQVEQEILDKQTIKQNYIPKLKFSDGPVMVYFD